MRGKVTVYAPEGADIAALLTYTIVGTVPTDARLRSFLGWRQSSVGTSLFYTNIAKAATLLGASSSFRKSPLCPGMCLEIFVFSLLSDKRSSPAVPDFRREYSGFYAMNVFFIEDDCFSSTVEQYSLASRHHPH